MTLKEIIKVTNWTDVSRVFLQNYPDQKKWIDGYEMVYEKSKTKAPATSKMELFCGLAESTFKEDDPFHEVYGVDGTKREDGELEKFSLALSSWSKWLGSSISESTLNNYTKEEIISHCLFDMTFHGFSEAETKKARKKLDKSIKDHESRVRYVIVSVLSSELKWKLFFNISDETWCSELDTATIFKRRKHAMAILKTLNKGKVKSNILAKITTKDKKRKILKYFK